MSEVATEKGSDATAVAPTSDKRKKFFEVIYETGAHSVVYGTQEEILRGLSEHQRRAVAGEYGRQQTDSADRPHNAERIKRVLVYDAHPGDHKDDAIFTSDETKEMVDKAIEAGASPNGEVHLPSVISHVYTLASALKRADEMDGRHDSQYRMKETGELDPSLWGGDK